MESCRNTPPNKTQNTTIDNNSEDRENPPGDRYPFFRRAVSNWSYNGTINRSGANLALNSNGVEITEVWIEEQNGQLVFDEEVRRYPTSGEPIKANDAINSGEGNGIWFEQ